MLEQDTFPQYLKNELGKRRSRNEGYSLRAFAKSLGVSSSFLSKVLNGKKGVGEKSFQKMVSRLGVDSEEIEVFRSKLPGAKPAGLSYSPLQADHFQYLSDWYHYAILESLALEDFEPTASWLSEKLKITPTQAERGLVRLIRLGYLERTASGTLNRNVKNYTTTHLPSPTLACREHERQVLKMAIAALDQVDVKDRDQSSLTVAVPRSRLPEARKKIDQFRREMASLLYKKGKRDEIYHFSISLYPVTQLKREN